MRIFLSAEWRFLFNDHSFQMQDDVIGNRNPDHFFVSTFYRFRFLEAPWIFAIKTSQLRYSTLLLLLSFLKFRELSDCYLWRKVIKNIKIDQLILFEYQLGLRILFPSEFLFLMYILSLRNIETKFLKISELCILPSLNLEFS